MTRSTNSVRLEGEYHYMGESHGAGDTVRLIFEENGKWIALQTWAAACYALKPRDLEIGWNGAMRAKRLKICGNFPLTRQNMIYYYAKGRTL